MENFKILKRDIGLTPCYDLAAAYCAITYLLDPDQHGCIFEDVEDNGCEYIVIRERYNTSRFVELCMTDGTYGDTDEEENFKMRKICRSDVSNNGITTIDDVEKLFGKKSELVDGHSGAHSGAHIESSDLKRNMTMASGHVIPPTTVMAKDLISQLVSVSNGDIMCGDIMYHDVPLEHIEEENAQLVEELRDFVERRRKL